MTSPAIRYHGGKWRLAPWLLQFFPEHDRYVEPFGGAGSVLIQKKRSYSEVYNDLDGEVVNFFRVLRDPVLSEQLIDACSLTPFAREEFEDAYEDEILSDVERARRVAVRAAMGFGSAGATKGTTGFRIDSDRLYGHAAHLWAKYPNHLAQIGRRFAGVFIENRPALEVMRQHDGPGTLHYCDPPYVMGTRDVRAARAMRAGRGYYRHEMTDADHIELLEALRMLEGMVVISGYANHLYDGMLRGWERHTTSSRIAAGRGGDVREEVAWLSPSCSAALRRPRAQQTLLDVAA